MFIYKNTEDAFHRIEDLLREVEHSMVANGRSNPKYLDIDLIPMRVRLQLYLTVETGEPCKEVADIKARFSEWSGE